MNNFLDSYINEKFNVRNSYIPFNSDSKILSLFGITGSGKTTFMQKMLGIDPENEKIPPTSTSRTTTYNFEAIVSESEYYQACVTFLDKDYIDYIIKDCLSKAVRKYHSNNDISQAFNVLSEDTSQTFRLKYIIGNIEENTEIKKKYSDIIARCAEVYRDNYNTFNSNGGQQYNDTELFELDELIHEELVRSEQFKEGLNKIYKDIFDKFFSIIDKKNGEIILDESKSKWPLGYFFKTRSRDNFIKKLHHFIGIQKKMWGDVITPLIDSVRISGPFLPSWISCNPHLAFIDGKGIGHSVQQSISASVEIFEKSDYILIIDEASKSMQQSTRDIITGIVKHGYLSKMLVCFSKYDALIGDNFETDDDKIDHILNTFRQLCEDIKNFNNEYGYQMVKDLENIQNSRFFYFPDVNSSKVSEKFSSEIENFLKCINVDTKNISKQIKPVNCEKKNRIDVNSVVVNKSDIQNLEESKFEINYNKDFESAIKNFSELWRAKLNLPSEIAVQAEHWTRIKALSRRLGHMNISSYDTLKPIDDFIDLIQSVIYKYAKKLRTDDQIIRKLSQINRDKSRNCIQTKQIQKWETAYSRSGLGSVSQRKKDIDALLDSASKEAKKDLMAESTRLLNNS